MYWTETISLLSTGFTVDQYLQEVPTETPRKVYANKRSIRQDIAITAGIAGKIGLVMFEIWKVDYKGEEKFLYRGKKYQVEAVSEFTDKVHLTGGEIRGG